MMDEIAAWTRACARARPPGPQALAAALDHPLTGDVIRYALTPEATALRRRLGTVWAG